MPDQPIKVLVTDRPDAPKDETIFQTPIDRPNVEVVSMTAAKQSFIRAWRTYKQGAVSIAVTVPTGAPQAAMKAALEFAGLPAPDHRLAMIVLAVLLLPLGAMLVSYAQNARELQTRQDVTNPAARA